MRVERASPSRSAAAGAPDSAPPKAMRAATAAAEMRIVFIRPFLFSDDSICYKCSMSFRQPEARSAPSRDSVTAVTRSAPPRTLEGPVGFGETAGPGEKARRGGRPSGKRERHHGQGQQAL